MNFFKRRQKIEIVRREETKLRLHEWQSQAELVGMGQRLWSNEDFRMAQAVLKNEHPANVVLNFNVQPHERIAHQARCEGYTIALANLEALARYKPVIEPLEATFEEPEPE